jgi:glycosyltransferase involved in cell wall biosynthesis
MLTSVVVRTRDEAPRLRLMLASLARQTRQGEVVVVNDGSTDATPQVLDEARARLDLTVVTHASAQGRSAASNAGRARRARRGPGLLRRRHARRARRWSSATRRCTRTPRATR